MALRIAEVLTRGPPRGVTATAPSIDDARRRHGGQAAARVPPHDLEAEESLLGAMLIDRRAIEAVVDLVDAADFYKPAHGHVFAAITGLYRRDQPSDQVTVANELRRAGVMAQIPEGPPLLITLQAATPSIGNAARYAEIVRQTSQDRTLALRAEDVHDAVLSGQDPAPALDALTRLVDSREAGDATKGAVRAAARRARIDGAGFVLDAPAEVQAVWGSGDQIIWPAGEPFLVNGPTGVGKTTLAQQVGLARLGLRSEVLGLPVEADPRRLLYIAADRPPQASRSLRRMVSEEDRDVLAERLVVWRGPLPGDISKQPDILAAMAEEFGAGTLIIDSLKDVAAKLSEDETGNRVNQALQMVCLAGVEVLALHHQRKRQQGGGKPKTLDDVFGSTWITAGAGSVLLLWGEAGDAVIEATHLKQPAEAVGPLTLLHDHERGLTVVQDQVNILDVVRTSNGITTQGAARALFKTEMPEPNEMERARRRLELLVKKGLAQRVDSKRGGDGGTSPARYYAVTALEEPS